MLFDLYEEKGLLFNTNFAEGDGKLSAYRGDLVLGLGEVGDALGHRKPPTHTTTLVLRERPPGNTRPTFLHKRGEYLQPKETVPP